MPLGQPQPGQEGHEMLEKEGPGSVRPFGEVKAGKGPPGTALLSQGEAAQEGFVALRCQQLCSGTVG